MECMKGKGCEVYGVCKVCEVYEVCGVYAVHRMEVL